MKRKLTLSSALIISVSTPILGVVSCGVDVNEQIDITEYKSNRKDNVVTQSLWFSLSSEYLNDEIFLLSHNGETDQSESYRIYKGAIKKAPYNTKYEINYFTESLALAAIKITKSLSQYQASVDKENLSLEPDKRKSLNVWNLNGVDVFEFTSYENVEELLSKDSYSLLNKDEKYDLLKLGIDNKSKLNIYNIILNNIGVNIPIDADPSKVEYAWDRPFLFEDEYVFHPMNDIFGIRPIFDDMDKYGTYLKAVKSETTIGSDYVYVTQPGVVVDAGENSKGFFYSIEQLNDPSVSSKTNIDARWGLSEFYSETDLANNPFQLFTINGVDGFIYDPAKEEFVKNRGKPDMLVVPFPPSVAGKSGKIIKRKETIDGLPFYRYYTTLEELGQFDYYSRWVTSGIFKKTTSTKLFREWVWEKTYSPGMPKSGNLIIILNSETLIKAIRKGY